MELLINLDLYPVSVLVVLDEEWESFNKILKKHKVRKKTRVALKDLVDSINGMAYVFETTELPFIIYRPEYDDTIPEDRGTLAHEILHTVSGCLRYVEIPLTTSSEEAYCYLTGYITKTIYRKFFKKNKTKNKNK